MTFTIIDPGYDFTITWVFGVITAVLLICAIAGTVGYVQGWCRDWVPAMSWIATALVFIMGFLVCGLTIPESNHTLEVQKTIVSSLNDLGFSSVYLSGDRFTASLDGKYFVGILSETDPYTYQVNEVVAK